MNPIGILKSRGITRRQMIGSLLGLGGGVLVSRTGLVGASNAKDISQNNRAQRPTLGASQEIPLDEQQRKAIAAAAERLLPGAIEAGVPDHLEHWLKQKPFAGLQREVRLAAVHLDRVAQQEHHKAFCACPGAEQDALLRRFQEGKVQAKGFDGAGFFQRFLSIVIEGYLADPKYGGNRKMVGWRFIGYEGCWWSPKRLRRVLRPDRSVQD
jgi:gluconate 2-dehydrogenase gamma chain